MPDWAATPVPAMIAVGVAKPRAQGQAITSTATAFRMPVWASPAASHHPRKVSAATPITAGTNTAATRSTKRWTGALAACAPSTRRTMRDSVPSAADAVASASSRPSPFIAPPTSGAPGSFGTGRLSPVSRLSSAWLRPSRTTASAGMRSPGRMTSRSPGRTASAGSSVSVPSAWRTRAVSGRNRPSARIASPACRLARPSSHLPRSTRVMTAAEASK